MITSFEQAKAIFSDTIFKALAPYREKIEPAIASSIERFGVKTKLRDACEYALQTGGKRFRPALVFMVAESIGSTKDVTMSALAVEFFHTASLIADDLPCMDNDDFRRGMPTVHKAYGETTALLACLALIAQGFEAISRNSIGYADGICQEALYHASRLNGINGLIGGQFLDINPPMLTRENLYEIIEKKTVTLFELSFILGWLFGGGDKKLLPQIQKAAFHFGSSFQILDDLDDMEKDARSKKVVNFANCFGVDIAVSAIRQHLDAFTSIVQSMKLRANVFQELVEGMRALTFAC